MIKSWKHKGLQRFFETGSAAGINPQHVKRIRDRLRFIDLAETIEDVNVAGYKLHPLQDEREGIWSVTVSGNWRITFEFTAGDAFILNYEDYH
ncbi:TPA: type II toxin-antitoxin system RelE/ParE family toxin [Yersinia enterocolitica]|uniref:type II toxin-antitoxin system RelE/ParE family toxin n=1 Tax=Yersinia enterocolitica TaxID=630 RepID=UPI0032F0BA79|nr:type II toxin-antitoxin system RelE/ParE family toxin [Yersinia enterocolitica]HDL6970974.1 type II toxin-antitoxin system RelE/ParE family toxin [Yersinia enterocolitica]HDL6974761.1 type II toxin-antitoxin system RelE/ParE family toxin [Yersinia enterocolitica]HDL6987148.1 type II toxin-antitoxin system RelE/ParE family toxin [Yersinia enterocolitica]HDL6995997.1 type II toxin-antitoxin system RelE/ParE family toxin [Yersinia enterocolitica]